MFAGRLTTPGPDRGLEPHRRWDRPDRLLHFRRVGHHKSACREERGVLHMLRGALPRYRVQYHPAPQDPLLHGEPDRTVRGHIFPLGVGVLPAERQRREGLAVDFDIAVVDGVLPTVGRDHTAHVVNGAVARQVPAVHDGTGHPVRGGDDRRVERELSLARHPPYGELGAGGVHTSVAAVPSDREAEEGGRRRGGGGDGGGEERRRCRRRDSGRRAGRRGRRRRRRRSDQRETARGHAHRCVPCTRD